MWRLPFLRIVSGGILILAATAQNVSALDGRAIVADRCVSCHDVTGPAPATFAAVLARKAPDLFYAGSKFKRPWLVEWMQRPSVIRRAGVMFLNHMVADGGKDRIPEGAVAPCPVLLNGAEAEAVAEHLMTLRDSAMKTGVIDPAKTFRKAKARRLFAKKLPCIGCHRVKFGKRTLGGLSGPDLSAAGTRLNPDWIYARIEDPQYWDPRTWMPKLVMSHRKREILTLLVSSMK